MARGKKKPGKKPRASGGELGARARVFAGVVLAAGALGASGWGVATVHDRAGELLAAETVQLDVRWPRRTPEEESWIGPEFRSRIVSDIESHLSGRVIDAVSLSDLGEVLQASGWFEGAPRLRRTADDAVSVDGVWRRPACVLRFGDRDRVIDWSGRPLPVDYAPGGSNLRVIVGAASEPGRTADGRLDMGAAWPGEDVAAGLELLAPLLQEGFASQIAGVDVGGYYTQGQLVILTDEGTRIVWGGRFGEFIPGEAPSDEKLARLRQNAANPQFSHRIDMGQRRIEIFDERYYLLDLTGQP